jgi:multimeric flavodoxin WrbA
MASPIYAGGVTGQMKIFMDRMITATLPFIEVVDDCCTHEKPEGSPFKGLVFVSNNGFHEPYHFDDLVAHMRSLARMMQAELLGKLLRPHGVILQMAEQHMPDKTDAVYAAARKAGRALVEEGRVPPGLEDEVARELIPRDAFVKAMNDYFRNAWEKGLEKKQQ